VCRITGLSELLLDLSSRYNMQTILSVLLHQLIPLAVVINESECTGDGRSLYFTLLSDLLRAADLDSTLVSTVIRFVSVLYE